MLAHREIDLKNPKTNRKNAGFTDEERGKFGELLDAGFIDTFRYFYPDAEGIYSWWSYRFSARAKNAGWRIDYFCVSEALKDRLVDAKILTDVMGSDHLSSVVPRWEVMMNRTNQCSGIDRRFSGETGSCDCRP